MSVLKHKEFKKFCQEFSSIDVFLSTTYNGLFGLSSYNSDWKKENFLNPLTTGESKANKLLVEIAKKYNLEEVEITTGGENGVLIRGTTITTEGALVYFEQDFYTINEFGSRFTKDYRHFIGGGTTNFLPLLEKENESISTLKNDEFLIKNPSYKIELKDGREIEIDDIIEVILTQEEFRGYVKGNAIKNSLRAGKKEGAKTSRFDER